MIQPSQAFVPKPARYLGITRLRGMVCAELAFLTSLAYIIGGNQAMNSCVASHYRVECQATEALVKPP